MNWQALLLTLKLASVVSVLLLVIGLPIAYWLAFSRARWKFLIEALVAVPLVLPPTVIGFYALLAFGPNTALGRGLTRIVGHGLAFTFEGLVIASLLYSMPFAVQPIAAGFAAIDPALVNAAATLGAGAWRRFWRVVLPLSFGAVLTGFVLSFAHTIGEFGVVLMVGGNIAGVTRTVSVDIYDRVQEFDFAGANSTSLFLLALSFVLLVLIYGVSRRGRMLGRLR
jgi:molybdate transport system permease protein